MYRSAGRRRTASPAPATARESATMTSRFALSDEAGRPEDQDSHEQEIGDHWRDLRDRHLPEVAEQRRRDGTKKFRKRNVQRDREGLHQAYYQRCDKRPGERTEASDDYDDEENWSKQRGHGGLRHQGGASDDARQPRQRRARAEHHHEKARHVMPQHRDHVRMRQRRLNDEADARPSEHDEQYREHRHRGQEHEHAICGIGRIEEAKGDKIERRRHIIIDGQFAPDHLHDLFDYERKPEGEQQLGYMAEPMQLPQPKTFNQGADPADAQWSYDKSRPEAEMPTDLEAKIGAEHVEACMSEIQHAHHAEHQGQSARQHEKQHPVKDAVESRENDDLQHRSPTLSEWRAPRYVWIATTPNPVSSPRAKAAPSCRLSAEWCRSPSLRPRASIPSRCLPRRILRRDPADRSC